MPSMHDGAGQGTCVSIGEQIAAIEAELAAEARGAVIDLSSPSAPAKPVNGRPRLVNARRSKFPVLIAWPSESGRTLNAWCPPCGIFHVHGRHGADSDCGPGCECRLHNGNHHSAAACLCRPGSGDGHRVAHCVGESPFKQGGYVVREIRP